MHAFRFLPCLIGPDSLIYEMLRTLSFIGGIGGQELIVIFFLLAPMLLTLLALIQCLNAKFEQGSDRLVWVLLLIFMPLLGPILWWTIGIRKTIR